MKKLSWILLKPIHKFIVVLLIIQIFAVYLNFTFSHQTDPKIALILSTLGALIFWSFVSPLSSNLDWLLTNTIKKSKVFFLNLFIRLYGLILILTIPLILLAIISYWSDTNYLLEIYTGLTLKQKYIASFVLLFFFITAFTIIPPKRKFNNWWALGFAAIAYVSFYISIFVGIMFLTISYCFFALKFTCESLKIPFSNKIKTFIFTTVIVPFAVFYTVEWNLLQIPSSEIFHLEFLGNVAIPTPTNTIYKWLEKDLSFDDLFFLQKYIDNTIDLRQETQINFISVINSKSDFQALKQALLLFNPLSMSEIHVELVFDAIASNCQDKLINQLHDYECDTKSPGFHDILLRVHVKDVRDFLEADNEWKVVHGLIRARYHRDPTLLPAIQKLLFFPNDEIVLDALYTLSLYLGKHYTINDLYDLRFKPKTNFYTLDCSQFKPNVDPNLWSPEDLIKLNICLYERPANSLYYNTPKEFVSSASQLKSYWQ